MVGSYFLKSVNHDNEYIISTIPLQVLVYKLTLPDCLMLKEERMSRRDVGVMGWYFI